ncbi:FKBP-type peptidyl-prolyl cis-trans isomerase [Geofilum sp. OHC36d9]|uniref:FKBP-type peptidyl-prolyl cis-trans isomerase n=1 Tax=Geofilum sp. OHC36d9 TaxID=3458413 RepID=UPI004033ABDC
MKNISYALGMNIAQNLANSGLEKLDEDAFINGLKAVLNGGKTEMSVDEANNLLQTFFTQLESKKHEAAIAEGKAFLEKNAKRDEVVTLASGLQYEVIASGDGERPQATDKVKCHYHGTLIDGTVFDSSVQRGEPAEFPVNGVIQGWVEALQLMQVGSKWRLFVPSELAYGSRGAGGAIGPHTTLIFEVELLAIA